MLYDGPSPDGHWRQPFFGGPRWFDGTQPRIVTPARIAAGRATVAERAGPVHLVVLDAPCVDSVACDSPDHPIGEVAGWEVTERHDLFTLYEPVDGQAGRAGTIEALEALADAYGPGWSEVNEQAADRRAMSAAYPGLTTPSMIASRSSNGRNADFIALIVNQRRSSSV